MTAVAEFHPAPHALAPAVPNFMANLVPVIYDDLPKRGVPATLLTTMPTTGPCGGIFATLLQSLIPMLAACIPAAVVSPQALLDELKKVPLRVEGIGLRIGIGRHIMAAIKAHAGTGTDAEDLQTALFEPLKASIVNQCGLRTLSDCTIILDQYKASLAIAATAAA